jgi:hypothetical protein
VPGYGFNDPDIHNVNASALATPVALDGESGGGESVLEGAVALFGPYGESAAGPQR